MTATSTPRTDVTPAEVLLSKEPKAWDNEDLPQVQVNTHKKRHRGEAGRGGCFCLSYPVMS